MSRQKGTNVPNQPTVPPMPPIQKMSRYIDADKLMNFANNMKDKTIDANDIARFPTADVRENVVGEWVKERGCVAGDREWKCSVCGAIFWNGSMRRYHYCPECGARMENKNDIS